MSDSETLNQTLVAPALSTVQTDTTFRFQKYDTFKEERSFYLGPNIEDLDLAISDYYNIEEIVLYLESHPEYSKITLQFPDSLVKDSSIVTKLLQKMLPNSVLIELQDISKGPCCKSDAVTECNKESSRKFWILADTAYSSCCVDEVASEHVNSQLVIHFGDACLNAIQKLPVVYSFGRPFLNTEEVVNVFKDTYPDKLEKICLMADYPCTRHIKSLFLFLKDEGYENLIFADINNDLASENVTILGQDDNDTSFKRVYSLNNRILLSQKESLAIEEESELQNKYKLFHITMPQDPHLLYLSTIFQSISVYDPLDKSVSQGPFPSLMKRYRYMHVARTAGCIGILVNTLSLRNTKETINKLSKLIKANGKKHYFFVVGKPNVAKLANFEAVDIWCILGCGQSGIILDQYNEFYKPIITPYELTLALNPEVTWTGKWILDFQKALADCDQEEENNRDIHQDSIDQSDERESEAPEFDAVTGKFISTSRPLRNIVHLQIESPSTDSKDNSKELIKNVSGGVIIKGTVSTSAAHLQSRGWTGLGSDFTEQEDYEEDGATLEQGIRGVARGYQFDRENSSNDK